MPRVLLAELDEGRAARNGVAHAVAELPAPEPCAVGHGVEQHRAADLLGRPAAAGAGDELLARCAGRRTAFRDCRVASRRAARVFAHRAGHHATFSTRAPAASCAPVML